MHDVDGYTHDEISSALGIPVGISKARLFDARAKLRAALALFAGDQTARGGDGRPAVEALLPIVMIDSLPRWDILAAAAADSTRMQRYRRRASDLLARAAASTLGLPPDSDDEPGATRREAVYALARQREKNEDVVPQLLEIARTNSHTDARVAAPYQLGQIGDARAIALFSSMLQGK